MLGYNKQENKSNEPLILEPEDMSEEEYKVLQKVFECPENATRIKVEYNSVEWYEEEAKQKKCQKVKNLAEYLDSILSDPGYADYIIEHLGAAVDVVRHGGCLIDLDNMVHLETILGFNVSYELYCYIDSQYDGSLLDIENWEELMAHVWKYVGTERLENI